MVQAIAIGMSFQQEEGSGLILTLTKILLAFEDSQHNLSLLNEEGIEEPGQLADYKKLVRGSLEVGEQGIVGPEFSTVLSTSDLEARATPTIGEAMEALVLIYNSTSCIDGDLH